MEITTNSAGCSGAKPTTMFTIPRLMSSWVVVEESHFTKYASFGLDPWKAPWSTTQVGVEATGLRPYFLNSILMVVPAVLISKSSSARTA